MNLPAPVEQVSGNRICPSLNLVSGKGGMSGFVTMVTSHLLNVMHIINIRCSAWSA